MTFDHDLDALGLLCPLPVLKARKRLAELGSGQVLRLRSDDPAAMVDVAHYCRETGHKLLATQTIADAQHYFIQKK